MTRTHFRRLLAPALCWAALWTARADPAPAPLPPVVARYEQMLVASPAKGTAFDKVYQYFFDGPGLDALAARWQARAAAGAGAETFPLLVGLLAERRAHPDLARAAYTQYNAAHPDDPRGWTSLGEFEAGEGHFVPAADALAHALAPGATPPVPVSTRPTLYRELARAQARSFLTAASLGTWRKLASEFPDDPGILQEVGEAFQEDQAYDEARATFEKVRALALQNNDPFGRINATLRTGQVEEARGRAADAVKIYEGVVAEAKTGSWLEREARARIEQLYRGQEDLPGLADYYKKWLEDHPKDVEVATRRAAVLIELNRRAEAIDLLKQAVAWAPERQELQVELARRLGETDRPAEMAAVMEKLTAVAPEEKSYWQLLGDARWQLLASLPAAAPAAARADLKAQSLAAWDHLAPTDSKDPAATGQLADLLASHNLKDEALAQYARAAALAPALPDARERWAAYLAQLDRKDEARRVVAGIVTAGPKNATAANYARLAAALDRLDDPAGALAATEQGLLLEPRNFDLLTQRWQLLASGKRWTDAVALYPRLLAATPNAYFTEQVQIRQVAALQAAGQLAETRATLTAHLATLDENDLALLVRIDLQAVTVDPDAEVLAQARVALAEGRGRFPRAATFARLEGDLAKRVHDTDAQVAALRRLSDLQPAQKTEALTEIAHVYRDANRLDDAVNAAHELALASPASAAAQSLLADLLLPAGHADEGVARLRDAVRLSDKPNEVRLRLARVLSDLGQDADARRTLDEAFEAAEDSHERLAITKPLTAAYQRENRLDELITRFQTLQQGDAEGWRYALYLAEIYQETKDYGAARRELAQALAARPHDGSLLRQLVRVAEAEQNTAEIARYQAILAEVEPSDQNRFTLVTALLENNQADAGFHALRTNLAAILKIPGAWDDLLPLLARNDLIAKAGDMLTAEMGGERGDIKAHFTLALFQAVAGNVDQARTAFWSVFDTKTSPTPLTVPAPSRPAVTGNPALRLSTVIYGGDSIPEQRYRAGEMTRRTAQMLLYPGGLAGYGRGRGGGALPAPPSGLPNTPSATDTTRDAALLYLAALAVKDHTASEFLAELDRHLAARDSSRADRLVAYALMEDVDSETREIAAQVQNPEPGLDGLALARTALIAYNNSPQYRRYSENPPLTAAQTAALGPLFDPLLARVIQADPALDTAETVAMRWFFLIGIGQKEKAATIRQDFLARVDARSSLDQLETALGLLAQGDLSPEDRALFKIVIPALTAAAAKSGGATNVDQYAYYPSGLFQDGTAAGKLTPDEFADTLVSLIPLWYPLARPPAGSPVPPGNPSYRPPGEEENSLPPTRFFEPNTFLAIQGVAQALHQGDAARTRAVLAGLDQQASDLPPERRIFPQIVAIYLAGFAGDGTGALTRGQSLLAAAPDDQDLRLLTGVLLGHAGRHPESVALLTTVDAARTSETPFGLQQLILAAAKAAKDPETARRAALRLVAMRVPPEQRESLVGDLRELGLTEQADALARATASPGTSSPGRQHSIFDADTAQRLEKMAAEKNEDGALSLARAVLAALPPPAPGASGRAANEEYVLRATVSILKRFQRTDDFIADAEKQLAKDPDSLALNYGLAILHADGDAALPYWRKLAELRPKDLRYQRLLAHHLAAGKLNDEAMTVYNHLLDQSPDEAFGAYDEIRFIYKGPGMIPLAERLLAWKPGAGVSSPYGPRMNAGYTFFQVARECATQQRPDLVIAVCRRGLELDASTGGSQNTDLSKLLITTLVEQNRRDEARDALIAYFLPPGEAAKTGPSGGTSQLGFRNLAASRFNGYRSWMATLSWNLDSVDLAGLQPLETARTAGLLPDLRAALQARQAADPEAFLDNDLNWLLTIVRLDLHDPALLADLPAILNSRATAKGNSVRSANDQAEVAIRLAIARRLLPWPGQESLALEAFGSAQKVMSDAKKSSGPLSHGTFSNGLAAAISFQQARADLLLDDPRSALAALRDPISALITPDPANGSSSEELRRCLGLLLRAGPAADPVYLDLFNRSTKILESRKNLYFAYDLEKNIRRGDNPHFQAAAWLLDDGGKPDAPDATLVYELRAEHPYDKSGPGRYPGSRGRSFPGSEGERTLTFSYGADPEHFAPIGQLETDRTFGTWTGPIPPGAGVIKVTIDSPRARDTAALAAEAALPKPTLAAAAAAPPSNNLPPPSPPSDYWLRIVRAPNLLTNPGWDGLPNRDPDAATFSIPGWKDLPAGLWRAGTGENPLPGRPYVQSDTFSQQPRLVLGARIPAEPGHAYFQSGWVRDGGDGSTARVGRRYLDVDGNVLKTSECPEFSTLIWRWHSQRLLSHPSVKEDDAIPPKTAFIEPFLRIQGSNEWTGLFLGKMD